jgi:hypothetical protein
VHAFAPLPGSGRQRQSAAAVPDDWRPIMPEPDDAPPVPQRHRRHGKPARTETFRDGKGRL